MKPEAVSTAISEDNLEIPLIDFPAFLSDDQATKKSTAQALLAGFQDAGFVYLRNHGIPQSVVENTFGESAKFFARSREEKDRLAWTTPEVVLQVPLDESQLMFSRRIADIRNLAEKRSPMPTQSMTSRRSGP